MNIDSLDRPKYKTPEYIIKAGVIMRCLDRMGYFCDDEHGIVRIIEENKLDVCQFDFPGGSFEQFKQDVANGKYDIQPKFSTNDSREQRKKDIASGKIYTIR